MIHCSYISESRKKSSCRRQQSLLPQLLVLLVVVLAQQQLLLLQEVQAWTPSRSSTFVIGTATSAIISHNKRASSSISSNVSPWTMYQESSSSNSDPKNNAWMVLSKTEAWISSTLANANNSHNSNTQSSSSSPTSSSNPYVRKEVSYYCENQTTSSILIIASIFRHLKNIRLLGESHIKSENHRIYGTNDDDDDDNERSRSRRIYRDIEPSTLRQTHVIVIPNVIELTNSFVLFDTIIQQINRARRNARDYITDTMMEKNTNNSHDNNNDDQWSIAINCAHLHPSFGQGTIGMPSPQSSTATTPTASSSKVIVNNSDEDNDPKYIEYQKQRLLARQSPYPTIVVEVRVTPTPDFFTNSHNTNDPMMTAGPEQQQRGSVSKADIQKLEALFGKSAHIKNENDMNSDITASTLEKQQQKYTNDDYLWDHLLGNSLREVTSPRTPIQIAQEWVRNNVITTTSAATTTTNTLPSISSTADILQEDVLLPEDQHHVSFTTTDTTHVDEAYEFVFLNIAMLFDDTTNVEGNMDDTSTATNVTTTGGKENIYYLVFPHYLSYAATSFEKFVQEVQAIYQAATLPSMNDVSSSLMFTTYHPEHIQPSNRSPLPILAIQRTK